MRLRRKKAALAAEDLETVRTLGGQPQYRESTNPHLPPLAYWPDAGSAE